MPLAFKNEKQFDSLVTQEEVKLMFGAVPSVLVAHVFCLVSLQRYKASFKTLPLIETSDLSRKSHIQFKNYNLGHGGPWGLRCRAEAVKVCSQETSSS